MSTPILHPIEKRIISVFRTETTYDFKTLAEKTKLTNDQLRRGIEWLKLKNLVNVLQYEETFVSLGKNAFNAYVYGLPERKLINLILEQPLSLNKLRESLKEDFNVAIANAKKNHWIYMAHDPILGIMITSKKTIPQKTPEEELILYIGKKNVSEKLIYDKKSLAKLKKRRDFIKSYIIKHKTISLKSGIDISIYLNLNDDLVNRQIDVEASVPLLHIPRIHPIKEIINEISDIFVSLGFSEILGNLIQPCFWNFDVLFTPQDHPAREMQDTFYIDHGLKYNFASDSQINHVSNTHKKNWHYNWELSEAKKTVLRTHTTCVTIKYLAEKKLDNAKLFSLGSVFRNEKPSYKHLVEFHQVEGIIIGNDMTLRDLIGIQKEFCSLIGLKKIKFWPTFFPYTEPSLQTMVYNEKLNKWVELFGMGILRPEVTRPLKIKKPVLALGGGIERIAMLKYEIDDVREFYNNNLDMLRNIRCL